MPTWSTLALFLAAGAVLVVVPGPNVLFIVACSLRQGRKAGVVAAAVGLSALLVSSAAAFTAVKYAGVAYLLYLGARTWLGRDEERRQFVDPDRGAVVAQTLLFGLLLTFMGTCSDIVYALLAGGASGWLRGTARRRAAERWVTGGIYVGLGVTTALTGPGRDR